MEEEPTPDVRACTDVRPTSVDSSDGDNHMQQLVTTVRRDLVAADLKWSLFVAASQSYKHYSCLRPFPPMFLIDGNKDFLALSEAIDTVPALAQLESVIQTLPATTLKLLIWVLVDLKEPTLSVVLKSEVESVLGLVDCELSMPPPSLVVQLGYDSSSTAERRWASTRQEHGALYAFHGSPLNNLHSILHHGLQQHLTKNTLFGQGVYLSSELTVSLPYSRTGQGWAHSCIGSQLSVVTLCEVIDHPTVHRHAEGRSRPEDSQVGEVPHKLHLVPNSDLVRVRYLLVYPAHPPTLAHHRVNEQRSQLVGWLSRNRMVVSLVTYAAVLISVGMSRSPTFARYWRQLCRAIGMTSFHD